MKQDAIDRYYTDQAGSGISVFRGSSYQKGHGIGSFLAGLFKAALPLIKSGARAVGKEALYTGANILGDIAQNKNAKESMKMRLNEAGENLKRKAVNKLDRMSGSGLKSRKLGQNRHLLVATPRSKRLHKKKKRTVEDIFN